MSPALSELPPPTISFASDNAAAVHPAVMDAMVAANDGSALAYGADAWTDRVERRFAELFGTDVTVALCWEARVRTSSRSSRCSAPGRP